MGELKSGTPEGYLGKFHLKSEISESYALVLKAFEEADIIIRSIEQLKELIKEDVTISVSSGFNINKDLVVQGLWGYSVFAYARFFTDACFLLAIFLCLASCGT